VLAGSPLIRRRKLRDQLIVILSSKYLHDADTTAIYAAAHPPADSGVSVEGVTAPFLQRGGASPFMSPHSLATA